ncbi:MAG: GFA family protein [Paracoccaceae bacterium]
MTDRTGQCMCGAVSLSAVNMADEFSACHCKMCQRWVGTAYKGVLVATENLTITGRENINVFASSDFAERANCNICGSAIWWRLTAGPYVGKTSIPVGLLDDTDGMIMSHEYFVDYKNSTNELPDSRVQRTGTEVEKIIADFMVEGSK